MKKNNAIAFGGTGNQIFAIASVIMDIKRFSPNLVDEFVVFHDGVSRKDKMLIRGLAPTRFIRYRLPIQNKKLFNQGTLSQFSEMVFSKYEVFGLLKGYKNVLFTDYDIVIQGDISELLAPCGEGISLLPAQESVGEALHFGVDEFDMTRKSHSVAFIAVHDNLVGYEDIRKWCYEKTKRHAAALYLPEQAVVNFAIQGFGLTPKHFDPKIYCLHPRDRQTVESPIILHAYGGPKFWNGLENSQWQANYDAWLDMGGTPNGPRIEKWSARRIGKGVKHLLRRLLKGE